MENWAKKAADLLGMVRKRNPLVHQITNYVTVNDCANITLAAGASPIMADDLLEAADIAEISSALVLNIGTLNERTVASMLDAGKKANELGIPVVLDPVGAGASKLRSDTVNAIIGQVRLTVIRGNLSEISFVAGIQAAARGVDSSEADAGNDGATVAKAAARRLRCVAAVTGAVDYISDGERVVAIRNGHPMLSKVTGTGCMATALAGAFAGTGGDPLTTAVGGVALMGIAGELAFQRAGELGTGSYRAAIIDAVSRMTPEIFEERAKIHEL